MGVDHLENFDPKLACGFGETRRLNENDWGFVGVANLVAQIMLCDQNVGG